MSTPFPSKAAACAYCELPLARPLWKPKSSSEAESLFCCFGCRMAAEITGQHGDEGESRWMLTRLGLAIFFTMNVTVFTMALWTRELYPIHANGPAFDSLEGLFRYLGLVFALPVLFLLGWPLAENAYRHLRAGFLGTDLLLVMGVVASFVYSAISVVRGQGHVYFEVGCIVLVMITLGRWLEATGKLKTSAALESLERLLPDTARQLTSHGEQCVPLAKVAVGDWLHVLPGERIPVDGRVQRNPASVDQQMVTGEYQPACKEVGDAVYAGTLNLDTDMVVECTAAAGQGMIWRLIEMVRAARREKGRYELLADRVSGWFIPVVATIALGTLFMHGRASGIEQGIQASLSVLLIACPCALGIATPMAVWAALGVASQSQVLFRNGESLERLAAIKAIRFDKTGTLAVAVPEVSRFEHDDTTDLKTLRIAATTLAQASNHSLAAAIRIWTNHTASAPQQGIRTIPGRGLRGLVKLDEQIETVWLGSVRLMLESEQAFTSRMENAVSQALERGESVSCLAWRGMVRGVFVFHEQLRPESLDAIQACVALGANVAVLTGDHRERAARVATELGVACQAELLPEEKVAAIEAARRRWGSVAMVGDGINDAPALAASDVGVAMGCGADVSRESAAVCLMSNDLMRLPWAIQLAKATVHTIRRNLFWAFFYNIGGIGLAATGALNPVWAALAMVLSSGFVVIGSLSLSRFPVPATTGQRPQPSNLATTTEDSPYESPAGLAITS